MLPNFRACLMVSPQLRLLLESLPAKTAQKRVFVIVNQTEMSSKSVFESKRATASRARERPFLHVDTFPMLLQIAILSKGSFTQIALVGSEQGMLALGRCEEMVLNDLPKTLVDSALVLSKIAHLCEYVPTRWTGAALGIVPGRYG